MARNQVQKNQYISLMCFYKQLLQIRICSITRCYCIIILNVIPTIKEWRFETRVKPNSVKSHLRNIVQFFNNSWDIAYSICVRVIKARGIYFIKHAVIQSLVHHSSSIILHMLSEYS